MIVTKGTLLLRHLLGWRGYLAEWVAAVNEHGGFGRWAADVSLSPSDLPDILARHAAAAA
jgi:hypothetical protein